jgi:RNA polymerase sigma-70 factor (ECF subfamily)
MMPGPVARPRRSALGALTAQAALGNSVTFGHAPRQDDENSQAEFAAVVEKARRLDAEAWERLYRRAYPALLAYASRRLGAESARDAVSETMARAVAGIAHFKWQGAGFEAWLYGIARHVVIDLQRQQARASAVGPPPLSDPCGPGPLEQILQTEEAQKLRRAFAKLGPDDSEVLELRVVAGLSAADVAAVLGKRPGAVRMAQARALDRLRRHLEEEGR